LLGCGYPVTKDHRGGVSVVTATTLTKKARKQATEIQKGAGHVADTVRSRAGELGGTIRNQAGQVGGTLRSRSGEAGQRAAVRTREARRKVGYWIAGDQPKRRSGWWALAAGAAGAAAAFFLDPVSGKRRRHVARDWVAARFRGAGDRAARAGRAAGSEAYGVWQSATHRAEAGPPENDSTLAHKVESEVFQDLDIPSGRINVNAEFGVITLRGTVDRPNQIVELERRTRAVNGVRDVQNLVHLSGVSRT
jgi:osmotically-inducible protein OsmY